MILAYGSGIGHRFVFGDLLRIRAWVYLQRLALSSGIQFSFKRLVCTFRKALRIQEYAIVLGLCSFRESRVKIREKSENTVRPA